MCMQVVLENWVPSVHFNQDPDRFEEMVVGARRDDGSETMDRINPTLPFRLRVVFDRATQNFYSLQTATTLTVKNVLLVTIGVPLHFIGSLIWNIVSIPLAFIRALFQNFNFEKVKQHLLNCLRAPYYALGCEIAALSALTRDPSDLRALHVARGVFASIEREWNHHLPRQRDVVRHSHEIVGDPKTFFMAYCFQPLGTLNAPTKFFRV
jgi:hypothetical protein